MNVVLCSGVMRSGSTWCYNILRGLIGTTADILSIPFYVSYLEGDGLDEFLLTDEALTPGAAVFKTHILGLQAKQLIAKGIVKNVCTIREPRDCVASRRLFKSGETLPDSIAMVRGSFATIMGLSPETTLFLDYKDIVTKPKECVLSMMDYLGLDYGDQNDELASNLVAEFSMVKMAEMAPQDGIDPLTEIHTNHIHGGQIDRWKTELSDSEILVVDKLLREEIDWYGNSEMGGSDISGCC